MQYQSVAQAAERLGVTPRAVQKWAKDGKILGAYKAGRDWMIPTSSVIPGAAETKTEVSTPLPLMSTGVGVGKCLEYVNSLEGVEHTLALGEYYYYSGQPQKGLELVEPLLDAKDSGISFSAAMIYGYCNLCLGHTHLVEYAVKILQPLLDRVDAAEVSPRLRALAVFSRALYEIELHIPYSQGDRLESLMRYLPMGLKMYACYLLASKMYFTKNYERVLGMVEVAIAASPDTYTVAMTYLYVLGAVALINLRQTEKAREYLRSAWEIGGPGGLYMPFVTHHGLLQGLVESFFEKEHPEQYSHLVSMIHSYNKGWRQMYKMHSGRQIADNLTIKEFSIAMLFHRGWRVKEIADHMSLSERTVKNYIQIIYEKLGISGRKELEQYMLQ